MTLGGGSFDNKGIEIIRKQLDFVQNCAKELTFLDSTFMHAYISLQIVIWTEEKSSFSDFWARLGLHLVNSVDA